MSKYPKMERIEKIGFMPGSVWLFQRLLYPEEPKSKKVPDSSRSNSRSPVTIGKE